MLMGDMSEMRKISLLLVFAVCAVVLLLLPGCDRQERLGDLLTVDLVAPSEIGPGETAVFKIEVQNISGDPLTLFARDIYHDFIVSKEDGTVVWNWGHLKGGIQILNILTFQSGEIKVYEGTWGQKDNDDNPVPAGTYFVSAFFEGEKTDDLQIPIGPFQFEKAETALQELTIRQQ
jgi:hypothetical protein